MWLRNLRSWLLSDVSNHSGRRRASRRVRLCLEPLEDRVVPAKVAYLVAGLTGDPGGIFPVSLMKALKNAGFEVDLANWNSANYLDWNTGTFSDGNNTFDGGQSGSHFLPEDPGGFSVGVNDAFTTPSNVLGIPIPSFTIPTSVGIQIDIGSPTQDVFVDAAVNRLKAFTSQDDVVLIGHSLGGSAVLTLAQELNQQAPQVHISLLGLLDPVGYAPSSGQALSFAVSAAQAELSIPSIPLLGLPSIGIQPLGFTNGVSNNADGETPGFRGDEFGGGVVSGPVPKNVEYFYNRWQTNSLFPVDFPVDGTIASEAQVSDQGTQNTTTAYSVLDGNPLDFLGLLTPYVDLNPFTYTDVLGLALPTFNSDFLKSTAQLHFNFPSNPTVDAELGAIIRNLFSNDLVVTNTNAGGMGSLAQAVADADASASGGFITFDPGTFATPQTIQLAGTLDLKNTLAPITILGPAAGVTIDGGADTANFFSDVTVAANTTVDLNGLTISDGDTNSDDSSPDGGGIFNAGALTVTDCTISGNTASGDGGGIFDSGTLTVRNTTISGNAAVEDNSQFGDGGGIFAQPPRGKSISLTLSNVTITGNVAGADGGGIVSAFGFHGGPALTLNNCTITGNFAGNDGGTDNTGTLTLNNTILAGNTATTNPDLSSDMNNKVGSFNSNKHNLIGGGASVTSSLAPLNYYGGPTQTMALLPGSPAIGAGQPIATITTDERGLSRSSHPDLGAFQTQGSSSLVVTSTADPAAGPGQLSLREAVNLANVTPGANTITFAAGAGQTFASAQTIQLAADLELDNTTSFVFVHVGPFSRPLSSLITLRSSITIDGPAAGITITGGNVADFSVFTVAAKTIASLDGLTISNFFGINAKGGGIDNENGATLTLTDSTVSHAASGSGGGIDNAGQMTVEHSTISGNQAVGGDGGGIDNEAGATLTVSNAIISGNSAFGSVSDGAGIDNQAGATLTVSNTTISSNSAFGFSSDGGGIDNSGAMTIENATIDGNSASSDGGVGNAGTLTVAGSTIAQNTAQDNAGGIGNLGALTLTDSTLSGNSAQGGVGGGGFNAAAATLTIANDTISGNAAQSGGGIDNEGALTVTNATLANNSAADGGGIDNAGTLALNNTIVAGNSASANADLNAASGYSGDNANLIGNGAATLAPLGNYGGPTQTIALLPGSPAIGAGAAVTTLSTAANAGATSLSVADGAAIASSPGDYSIQVGSQQLIVTGVAGNILTLQSAVSGAIPSGTSVFLATDQRGFSRPATTPDLGAFQTQRSASLVVTSAADPVAGAPLGSFTGGVSGQLTLREAVNLAELLPGNSTITFAAAAGQTFATPQTITLAAGLSLKNTLAGASIAIDGPPTGVTIAGGANSNFSVFTVAASTTASLDDLTISNGHSSSNGGGIENDGSLTVFGVTVSHNSAHDGGAIDNQGTLSLSNSTIAANTADLLSLTIGNVGEGGGIDNEAAGTMTISNVTIADNSATGLNGDGNGGGIFNTGTLTLSNTIVAGNSAKTDADVDGAFGGNKHNTIGSGAAFLAALANNGGPTATIAPKAGSPALGKGGAVTQIGDDSVAPTDTTITVTNAAALGGTAVNYFIQIGGEIMLVTQVTGNTLTVERGFFNTAAASHQPSAGVYLASDQRGVLRSTTAPNIGAFEANATPLTTFLAAAPTALVFGQALQLTSAVTGPAGAPPGYVLFVADNTTILGSATLSAGVATITTTALPLGSDTITALYVAGGAGSGNTTSNAVTVNVAQSSTTVSGFVTPANPQQNQLFTFTATVSAVVPGSGTPTGFVRFQVDSSITSFVALTGGTAALVLPNGVLSLGPHVLTATYLGDSNFAPSAPFTLNVNPSTISGALTPSNVVQNQPFTFTATVSGQAAGGATPTGFVQFQVDGNAPSEVALAAGQAALDFPNGLPGGAHVITATYLGDGNFDPSSTFTQTLPFNADVAVTANASSSSFVVGQNLTYTVTVVNNGPEVATGVTATDVLPAGVTLASADFNQGSVAIAGSTAIWALGTLADGASATLTLIVTPTAAAGSTLTNTASVSATTPDPNQANNTATVMTPLGIVTPFEVTNTNATGPGSLAQAILDSNAHGTFLNPGGVPNVIDFDIPAGDPGHVYYQNDGIAGHLTQASITTTTATDDSTIPNIDPDWPHSWYDIDLPVQFTNALTITTPVLIDGYSQPGASPNSNDPGLGDNAVLTIDVDGTGSIDANGLIVNAPNCTIQGLAINSFNGVLLDISGAAATGNVVQGDFIGTDISGKMAQQVNAYGVVLDASQNTIGGTTPAARNVISGNSGGGITIGLEYGPDTGNVIEGNFIGADASGAIALGNNGGIAINEQSGNTIGGTTPSARNIISGNISEGISISSGFTIAVNNVIQGNYIGTDVTGTTAVPNTADGVFLNSTPDTPIEGNVISGNNGNGVTMEFGGCQNDTISGNFIGTAADGMSRLGNGGNGVGLANNPTNNTVSGNTIAFNSGAGVNMDSGSGDAILANTIYANGKLGINLGGVVQNTPGGPHDGPNNLQNYPVITVAQSSAAGTTIQGTFNSTPSTNGFVLQFFASPTADPSGYGQGETFLGSTTVNTDQNGNASFTVSFSTVVPVGQVVSATATDPNNNTSEFSLAVPVATASNADLAVTAMTSANSVVVGNNLTYTITVTNNGPGTALAVTLTDTLPSSVTLVSAAFSQGSAAIGNGTVTLFLNSLVSDASATLTLVVTPATATTITDTASVTSDTPDPDLANNTASVQTTVDLG